jgi:cytochrome P450
MGVITLAVLWHFAQSHAVPRGLKAVPGPQESFIYGNARQLSTKPQRELKKWAREYGELFQLRLGQKCWVFVNSAQGVRDIFEQQSAKTSSKASLPVADNVISGGMRIVLMPDSRRWRDFRGEIHRLLTPTKAKVYMPCQELEASQMIYDLLVDNKTQSEFYMHSRRFATSVIMSTTYGRRIPSWVRERFGYPNKHDC